MIVLRKSNFFCYITIFEDLFGGWHVTKKSGCIDALMVRVKTFDFESEKSARLKVCDLEIEKRKKGYTYID